MEAKRNPTASSDSCTLNGIRVDLKMSDEILLCTSLNLTVVGKGQPKSQGKSEKFSNLLIAE